MLLFIFVGILSISILCLQFCNPTYPKNSWIEEEACEVKSIQLPREIWSFKCALVKLVLSTYDLYMFPQVGWDLYTCTPKLR